MFQHFDCLVGQGQVVLWLIPQSMKLHQPIFNFALKVLMYLRSFVRLIISSQFRRGLASYRSWFDSQIRKFLGIYYQVGRYLLFNCIVFKDHDFFFSRLSAPRNTYAAAARVLSLTSTQPNINHAHLCLTSLICRDLSLARCAPTILFSIYFFCACCVILYKIK